ncbi:MAG TPA: fatty acid desaturase [Gammaproteobacteria bacterium]|nr:fatty acid desaturase [Gammaproteobacteria bacterium]
MAAAETTALRPEWLQPSDAYAWAALARNTLPVFLLLGLAPALRVAWPLAPWLLTPVLGLFLYRVSIVMHDCGHRTLFRNPRGNDRVGRVLGALTGIDYHNFGRLHWRHHRVYGEAGDPQAFHYHELRALTPTRYVLHLLRPLAGLNLRYVLGESALSPKNLRHAFASGAIVTLLCVQAAVLVLVTGGGAFLELAALPFISAATFGLFFSQLRGIAEHATLETPEAGHVRTHAPHWLDRLLLYDLHFNYHFEHHAHPQIPSCHLPAVHAEMAPGTGVRHGMLRTLVELARVLEARVRG